MSKLPSLTLALCLALFVAPFARANACTGEGLALEKCLSSEYLAKVAAEPGATVVEGGVIVRPIFTNETGAHPKVSDTVTVGYSLQDREGKVIETTANGDELATFPLDRLIPCWKTAIPRMTLGSFYKVSCPSDTAYGDRGAGDGEIKGGAALTFRISLYDIATDGAR